jgi:hypothetical protein
VSGVDPQPIAADSLRLRAEWQAAFPASTVISEETADEGRGIGFDGLDPSAMVRALFATRSHWSEILYWYRSHLELDGWQGREVKPGTWWEWTSAERPGEKIDLLDRGVWRQLPGWPSPEELVGQLGFEVYFTARGAFSETMSPADA